MHQQHLNKYINIHLHRECPETSFICCFIVTAKNLIWPVVFSFFCSWWLERNIYLQCCGINPIFRPFPINAYVPIQITILHNLQILRFFNWYILIWNWQLFTIFCFFKVYHFPYKNCIFPITKKFLSTYQHIKNLNTIQAHQIKYKLPFNTILLKARSVKVLKNKNHLRQNENEI